MGKKKVIRAVLDTNTLVSALLFRGGLSRMVELWKRGKIVAVFSRATFEEFRHVLAYPKFKLGREEIEVIVEDEVLPFIEVVEVTTEVRGVCRDLDDDKFLSCAVACCADFIVSGDKDLAEVREYKSIPIINPREFLSLF